MASYYKYAEKKVENEVNWGSISKGITDSLTAEADSRVKRKAVIDKASNDDLIKLMDKPQSEYVNESRRIADYSEQAQKAQLASLRLLKSGAITEQDYNFRTNNLRTGTDMAFNLSGQYQEQYGKHMDDIRSGKASAAQAQLLAKMEQFGNPKDSKYYVNPLTGEVSLALTSSGKGKQVRIGDSSFDLVGLNTAKNIINQTISRYDSDANTTGIADGLGKRIQTLIGEEAERGYFITEQDAYEALKKDGGSKALDDSINASFAGDPNGKMSFLIDTLKTDGGKAYTLVYDEKDKGGPNILMVPNSQGVMVPELTTEQEGLVLEGMRGLIKNKLDNTRKITVDSRVQTEDQAERIRIQRANLAEKQKKGKEGLEKEVGYLRSIDNVISGDTTTAQASIDAMIQGANVIYGKSPGIPNIKDAQRSEDGKTLTVTRVSNSGNEESVPYDISDPNKAGEVMVELFFPNVKGSYEELLNNFNREGGFTSQTIVNPNYEEDENGVPVGDENKTIPNPKYQGDSASGKTKSETKINLNYNTDTILGENEDETITPKEVIENVDMDFVFSREGDLKRAKKMLDGADKVFSLLQNNNPNLILNTEAGKNGLTITAPSVFEGDLLISSVKGSLSKNNYSNAIKALFNSIVNGQKFDKSKYSKKTK